MGTKAKRMARKKPPISKSNKKEKAVTSTDILDPVTAWKCYKTFEGFSFSKMKTTSPSEVEKQNPLVSEAETFLSEMDRLAGAAKVAGCTYTNSVLAFKILEKCQLLEDSDIEDFLTNISLQFSKTQDDSSAESDNFFKSASPNDQGEVLLSLVKAYIFGLIKTETGDTLTEDLSQVNDDGAVDRMEYSEDLPMDDVSISKDDSSTVERWQLLSIDDNQAKNSKALSVRPPVVLEDDIGALEDFLNENQTIDARVNGGSSIPINHPLETTNQLRLSPSQSQSSLHNLQLSDSQSQNASVWSQQQNSQLEEILQSPPSQSQSALEILPPTLEKHPLPVVKCHICLFAGNKTEIVSHLRQEHVDSFHPCVLCDAIYLTSESLARHKKLTHDLERQSEMLAKMDVNHLCNYCGQQFDGSESLTCHVKNSHEIKKVKCDACSEEFVSSKQLNLHRKKQHGLKHACELCNKDFPDQKSLYSHNKTVHGPRYPCDLCGKVLNHKNMKAHKEIVHEGNRLSCEQCGKQFSEPSRLKRHKLAAHSENPIDETRVCEKCGKRLKDAQAMSQHMRKVHDFKKHYACSQCDYAGKDTASLRAHVRLEHEGKKLPCDQCEFQANSLIGLYQHRARHKNPVKRVNCQECGVELSSLYLNQHMEVKHGSKDGQCPVCSEDFQSKEDFKVHLISRHPSVQQSYACDKCDFVSWKKSGMHYHKWSAHLKTIVRKSRKSQVVMRCDLCDFAANSHTNLRYHVLSKHEGVTFPCDQCDFEASHPNYLSHHKKAEHLLIRHACDLCDYKTKQRYRLKAHKQAMHDGVPFPCGLCDRKFSNQIALNKHKKSKHSVSAVMMTEQG